MFASKIDSGTPDKCVKRMLALYVFPVPFRAAPHVLVDRQLPVALPSLMLRCLFESRFCFVTGRLIPSFASPNPPPASA